MTSESLNRSLVIRPVLQLTNLHGDIIATAQDSETATGLASTINEATDYGVPATETPPRYSWLGTHEIPTELPSGIAAMGARSYAPQLGRFLQTDPVPGGSANAYAYVFGDPVNSNDLSGAYSNGPSAWALKLASELSNQETAAYEAAIRAEAERKAAEAAAQAKAAIQGTSPQGEGYEEEGPEEEYEEEGSGEENVAWHHGAKPGQTEAHTEAPLLYQPLDEEENSGEGATTRASTAPLCKTGSQGPCMRHAGLFKALFKVVVGAGSMAVGAIVYGVCVAGSEALGVLECAKAAGGPMVAGALLVQSGLAELTSHHGKTRRRK
jgi:RHS repeat-associated protein